MADDDRDDPYPELPPLELPPELRRAVIDVWQGAERLRLELGNTVSAPPGSYPTEISLERVASELAQLARACLPSVQTSDYEARRHEEHRAAINAWYERRKESDDA